MRLRLDIAYDGGGFHGWAAQDGLRTVQGELELWIQRVLRSAQRPELVVAGRTDAGVHARGQVAHLDLADDSPADETAALLQRRLRRALPADVQVRRVALADPGFDARFSAIWRRYAYRLTDAVPDPLLRNQVAVVRAPIDVDLINTAARALLGLHDFAAFCRAREGATTVRELQVVDARRVPAGHVEITVRADAFCHSMVRSLVGALVEVGGGRRSPAWLAALLDAGGRSGDVPVMPAHGLVLEEVGYPPADRLAARAAEARARRVLADELPGDCPEEDA